MKRDPLQFVKDRVADAVGPPLKVKGMAIRIRVDHAHPAARYRKVLCQGPLRKWLPSTGQDGS